MFRRKIQHKEGSPVAAKGGADQGDETAVNITRAPDSQGDKIPPKSRVVNDFTQQKLKAWQPSLSPKGTIALLVITGLVLQTLGWVILITSIGTVECRKEYTNMQGPNVSITLEEADCSPNVKELTGDIFLYYELTRFYQNHRRYIKSRSDGQLQGNVYTKEGDVESCSPDIKSADGKILHPCGLSATATFNDTITLMKTDGTPAPLDETQETITWKSDVGYLYKNPSDAEMQANMNEVDFWLWEDEWRSFLNMDSPGVGVGVENSHFVVWMRDEALPDFRKLYAKVKESPLKLPVTVKIKSRFDVRSYEGTKSIVITENTWIGGRNLFLGTAYLVVSGICLFVGGIFFFYYRKSPRPIGDIAWLRKGLAET